MTWTHVPSASASEVVRLQGGATTPGWVQNSLKWQSHFYTDILHKLEITIISLAKFVS